MATEKTLIMSLKLLIISTIVLVLVLIFSPLLTTATSELPAVLTAVKSYLRPPYLYVIINGIIITIVASSRLHSRYQHVQPSEREVHAPLEAIMPLDGIISVSVKDVGVVRVEEEEVKEMLVMNSSPCEVVEVEKVMWGPPLSIPKVPLRRQEAVAGLFDERPPAVSRFGHNRRPSKVGVIQGRKALRRVAKPKKHDTLESTWKAITEGRHMPLTRHLKKSDSWENNNDRQIDLLNLSTPPEVKKSKTFTDRTNHTLPPVPPKLKKEPSLGQDELNRRVEAFINKFNEDMRLQRQQSAQQFMEMINRAA